MPSNFSFLSPFATKPKSRRSRSKHTHLLIEGLEERRLLAALSALTWSAPAETGLPSSLSNVAAVLASDHSILLLGANSSAVYDQTYGSSTWTSVNSLVSPVYPVTVSSPGFASIGGGKFLVYGNLSVQLPDDPSSISALQYDPVNAGNIAAASAMSTPRTQFAYATDGSNDAYAIGGVAVGTSTLLSTVERYNSASRTWSYLSALPQPISGAAAAYDGNGHIFLFGGVTGTTTSAATLTGIVEEYTIATDTWTTLSQQMSTAATQAAAVLGTDVMIYVLGGKGSSNQALANVQVYNPAQNTWSQGTAFPHSLYNEAAVIDASGEINVIGQYSSNGNPVQVVYVSQVLANVAPSFTTTLLPAAMAGNPYSAMVTVTATPPATISVQSGPTGLNIDSNTGTFTWTPPEGLANTQQSVTIQATNPYGTATETISIAVTPDATIPTTPSYPSVVTASLTTSSIPLTWNASTDGDGVAGYTVYAYTPPVGHSGRGGGITKPAVYTPIATGITTTSYTVMGLSPGTTYQYAVAAYDPAGKVSGYSNVVTGTTLSAPTIIYYLDGVYIDPALSVVANHQLYFTLSDSGNPTPTLTMSSAPSGVVFGEGQSGASITWTPTADQVGVNDIIMQSTNIVGTTTMDIQVTVTPDLPVPSLIINGGYAYGVGNMTVVGGSPFQYQLTTNPGFNNDNPVGPTPQYAMVGTPFAFQFSGMSNTSPTTYALVSGPANMTLDPNTGIGAWTPAATDAAATTTVVVSATNSAGTSLLTFTFPTYFTTAPTNVADAFYTNTSKSAPPPTITWTAPVNSGSVADYKLAVTDANTNATTVYDTGGTATSYTLSSVSALQDFVTVTAYDAHGNPSMASSAISFEVAAMQSLGWTFSSPNAIVGQAFSVPFSPASPYYSYSIASGPSGASINATTGLLTWTPTLADVGTANIVVAASNGWGTVYATLSFPVYVTGPGSAVTLNPADWTSAGFTLTQGSDGNDHVYLTGTTTDVVSPITLASLTSISISAPNSAATLTIDSSNGDPIPAGGLTYSGAGRLIKTGSGVVTLSGSNSYTGGTKVADGTLLVSNSPALPTTGGVTVGANGILENGGGAGNTTVESINGAGGVVIDAGSSLTANSINLGSLVIGGTDGSPAIVTIAASDANGNPLNVVAASSTSTAHAMAGFQPATPIAASVSAIANASPLTSTTDSSEPPIFGAVAPSSHNSPGSALEVKSNSFDSVGLTALQSSSETGGLSDGTLTASNESERSSSMTTTGLTSTPDGETSLERQSSTISNGMGEFLHRDAVAAVFADADVLEWAALTPASRNPAADADISLMPDEMLAAIGLQWQN